MTVTTDTDAARFDALIEAETRALALLDAIEAEELIVPGRTERAVEQHIRLIAERDFGVTKHWHKRVVRAGVNTLMTAGDNPPDRAIAEDDIVFLDLGPVFEEWEADVGRSYAVGPDPLKHKLCADLPIVFERVRAHYLANPEIIGASLYEIACREAEREGWSFGGKIAGHIVGDFPHAHVPGEKDLQRIAPANPHPLSDPDAYGRERHWILEIHLVDRERGFGGFYERLMRGPAAAG